MNYQDLIKDNQAMQSDFQVDFFVIMSTGGTTPYGQYKQALREVTSTEAELKRTMVEREKAALEADEKDGIEKVDALCRVEGHDRRIDELKRLFFKYYSHAAKLKEQVGELTDARRYELEKELFYSKFKEMAALDIATDGRISKETYRAICMLPAEFRTSLLEETRSTSGQKELVEWYESRNYEISMFLDYDETVTNNLLGMK